LEADNGIARMPSPSMAKNQMGRAVDAILDPRPTQSEPIWEYFDSQCAYCGTTLSKADRVGHIDHAASGGGKPNGQPGPRVPNLQWGRKA
jgi:hypothetical protein